MYFDRSHCLLEASSPAMHDLCYPLLPTLSPDLYVGHMTFLLLYIFDDHTDASTTKILQRIKELTKIPASTKSTRILSIVRGSNFIKAALI